MAKIRQPVTINDVEFDALLEENQDYSASVPEYATEDGFAVSDTIALNAEIINMVLYITDTPVTWLERHGTGRTEETIQMLKNLFFSHKPVTVVTNREVFTNMAIETLSFGKNVETGNAREVTISLKKVRITKVKTTTIPSSYGKSGETGAVVGNANTSTEESSEGDGQGSSILWSIFNKDEGE